jgi:uncharacterized membrane protein
MRNLVNIFVTGLLAALPLAATLSSSGACAWWWPMSGRRASWGPLVRIRPGITGSAVVGNAIGVAAIFLPGLLVQTRLRSALQGMTESVVQCTPLVRNVYDMVNKFVGLHGQRDDTCLKPMRLEWLHFGGALGAGVLGLLSTAAGHRGDPAVGEFRGG